MPKKPTLVIYYKDWEQDYYTQRVLAFCLIAKIEPDLRTILPEGERSDWLNTDTDVLKKAEEREGRKLDRFPVLIVLDGDGAVKDVLEQPKTAKETFMFTLENDLHRLAQ